MTFTDRLRNDVWRLIGNRPAGQVAEDIGISRWTLWRFLRGEPIGSTALDAIDKWVVRCSTAPKQHT